MPAGSRTGCRGAPTSPDSAQFVPQTAHEKQLFVEAMQTIDVEPAQEASDQEESKCSGAVPKRKSPENIVLSMASGHPKQSTSTASAPFNLYAVASEVRPCELATRTPAGRVWPLSRFNSKPEQPAAIETRRS